MEQIACKECTSPDCHGCNMYRLERMLMSGKLDALMDENRGIKMDADVRPVVFCRDCDCWNEWDSAGRESLGNYVCSCAHWSVEDGAILYTRPTDFCSYGEKREE